MRGIETRTSRMLSERCTIWATSPWFITVVEATVSVGKQEVKSFLGRYFLYKTSIFSSFLKKVKKLRNVLNFGDAGYCSPYFWLAKKALYHLTYIPCLSNLAEFFSLSQQLWSFFFRSQKIYLLGISICNRLSADSAYHLVSGSCFGDARHRSPYLSHAKRALYHLSYIPIV